jgi:hypothetical protein
LGNVYSTKGSDCFLYKIQKEQKILKVSGEDEDEERRSYADSEGM